MLQRVIPLLCALVLSGGCAAAQPYGVFVGLDAEQIDRLAGYATVVIDAQGFTAEDLARLHQNGQTVYTYLNIGSVEQFRDYYGRFEPITLGEYENWPGERWVDVASPEWRGFVLDELAPSLREKGVDGFFLDNADVYGKFPREDIYESVRALVQGLSPALLNGGDEFVRETARRGGLESLELAGINQECVFTDIDFEHSALTVQEEETTAYYLDHLALCRDIGLRVYLTEYAPPGAAVRGEIDRYCQKTGATAYVAETIELD